MLIINVLICNFADEETKRIVNPWLRFFRRVLARKRSTSSNKIDVLWDGG